MAQALKWCQPKESPDLGSIDTTRINVQYNRLRISDGVHMKILARATDAFVEPNDSI